MDAGGFKRSNRKSRRKGRSRRGVLTTSRREDLGEIDILACGECDGGGRKQK